MEPGLTGVPETTLWTLHNRASEARRADGRLHDPWAVTLFDALDHPYHERFGAPSQSHSLRARCFDAVLRDRLEACPDPVVVALGEGLQTTFWRLGHARVRWYTVDLPEIIALRGRLLPAEEQVRSLATSALDPAWMDAVRTSDPTSVTITAEGLLMYFTPEDALGLIADCAARFPGGQMLVDMIPPVLSRRTLRGWEVTKGYTAPRMPFGITVPDMLALPSTVPGLAGVDELPVPPGRGMWSRPVVGTITSLPVLRHHRPAFYRLRFAG